MSSSEREADQPFRPPSRRKPRKPLPPWARWLARGVFGLAGHATLAETSRRYAKVLWWALVVLVLTGLLMIVGEPVRELVNPYFWIKMILVVVGAVVSVIFARNLGRQAVASETVGGGVKATAVFLVILWCMIMWCGRWIAYAPVYGGFDVS